MEGRRRQDASNVRRSGTFSGRQVPLEMGKVRVGSSGRPVPAVFTAAASRHAVNSSQEATAAQLAQPSPRVTLDPHPRSPFRRKEEHTKTVVRVSEDSSGSRFQVKKVTGPHLSARSSQIRFKTNRSSATAFTTRSAEKRTYRDNGMELSISREGVQIGREDEREKTSQFREQMTTNVMDHQQIDDKEEESRQDPDYTSAVDLFHTVEQKEEVPLNVSAGKSNIRPPELPERKALELPPASAGAGTFVSSMPSLTKLQSSFTARELALFTRRLETSEIFERNVQTRYHVASHPHSTTTASLSRTNQERVRSKEIGGAHKRALPPSRPQREVELSSNEKHQIESSWKRVDTSIDHIYEDPSIDMVQSHLLHSHNTTSGQKKRKMLERERVLAAASDLREHQSEEQRRQEQLRQRKLHLQKMSEAIRLQNYQVIRARAAQSSNSSERRVKSSRRSESAPTLPERKPPVPRLSRNVTSAKSQQLKRKRKPRDEVSRPQGGVSASILMDVTSDSSVSATQQEVIDTAVDEEVATPTAEHQTVKRKPPSTTPCVSKKKKQGVTAQPAEAEAAIRAREERRAIAREYMQLQKHSRRIWNAKAKEQSQREQEKRQRQLDILEATRLKNLRLSKKRSNNRTKQDSMVLDDHPTATAAVLVVPDSNHILRGNIDTPTKPGLPSESSSSDKELDLDESQQDNENDQAVGNVRTPALSLYNETGVANFDSKPRTNHGSEHETNPNTEADERVRKLLELREKAAALSARLSGLRNRTDTVATMEVPQKTVGQNQVILGTQNMVESADDKFQDLAPVTAPASPTISRREQRLANLSESHDEETMEVPHVGQNQVILGTLNMVESANDEFQASANDIENNLLVNERDVQQHQVLVDATDFGNYASGDQEIDIRSIGVYNIGMVWPVGPQNESTNIVPETEQTMRSPLASSSNSSSSASASAPASPRISRREQWLANSSESHDEENEDNEKAFEVAFHQQLKNKLDTSSALIGDETSDTTLNDRKEAEESVKSGSGSDSESNFESFAMHTSQRKFHSADRDYKQRRETSGKTSEPSAGLMRLIRETDDSLSVIDRTAKKLYHEQLERLEREREKELQERMEAEKKELLEKDLALKAVMASITGKKSDSDVSDSDGDADENEMHSSQYKRLEEIMDEVERERARENEESSESVHDDSPVYEDKRQHSREPKPTRFRNTQTSVHHRDGMPVSPSSAFWDQLVAETTSDANPDHDNVNQPHVEIDDSELVAQRESRLCDDDEQMEGRADSPPRVHSPRTLSRRLMAAVDYQEAIFEAHLQLSMMEHAHELETVQTDTITLAQAFKEEMENNARSHQHALDHATLEKKFAGDMQDVMQQLDAIRQVEEQERVAKESLMKQELKLANMRECSVQTESLQRADAATSAALCVDTSTSPIRFGVDVAVQHEEQCTPYFTEHLPSFEPPIVTSSVYPAPSNSSTHVDDEQRSSTHRDEYTDEFTSDPENGDASKLEEESNDRSGKTADSGSIGSVHSEVSEVADNSSASSDMPETSEVAEEEDFELESDEDNSHSVQEEEDQYEDEFASMSEDPSVQKDIVIEAEITETSEIAEGGNGDSVHDASDYYEDFASISESTPNQITSPAKSSAAENTEIEEQDVEENEKTRDGGAISSGSEVTEDERESRASNEEVRSDEIAESDQPEYSDDGFECSHLEQSALSHSEHVLEQSVEIKGDGSNYDEDFASISESIPNQRINQADSSAAEDPDEDQYEDEFASISEAPLVQNIVVEADIAETSEISEEGKSDGSDYDENFASIDESTPNQITNPEKSSVAEGTEIDKQDVEEDEKTKDGGAISSDSEIAEAESGSRASDEEMHSNEIAESHQQEYLDDEFESGRLKQSALPHSEHALHVEEPSVSVRVGQSSSEDSSRTKLLIAEVTTLQAAAGATYNARGEAEDRKLAKKKAKVEELLHTKERLLNQQKDAFRRDEEKRQVDVLANMALGVDVEGELSRAKAEISQQLASDFNTLQQTYPILKVANSATEKISPTKVRVETVPTPSVMSKLFGKNAFDKSSVVEEAFDEEYGVESFEEEQNDSHSQNKTSIDGQVSEVGSYEADEVENSQPSDQYDEVEGEDSNYEVASEVPSHQSDVDEDEVPSAVDEEENIVDEQETSGSKSASDDYENEYENDYENESFDEAQSVPDYEEGGVSVVEETPVEGSTKEENMLEKAEYDDKDAYSDEGFDSASESFTNEAVPASEADNSPSTRQAQASEVIPIEETSTKEEDLTAAIETMVGQLEEKQPKDPVSTSQLEPDHTTEPALNESKSLATSVSVSLPRDVVEESLTKSIEERTTRLQALKQKIEDRKSEILAVQKQMRVERRKEKLVTEEKLLWEEMESVERLLHADEEALVLCRQRNQLEMMHLDARQMEHSMYRKHNGIVCDQESDLLDGFDYVEEAQLDHRQQRYPSNVAPRRGHSARESSLLDEFAYIEAAEPVDSNLFASGVVSASANIHGSDGNNGAGYEKPHVKFPAKLKQQIEDIDRRDNAGSVGESITDDKSAEDLVVLGAVNNDPRLSSELPKGSRNEDAVDRVAILLYADLLQELDEEIMTFIRGHRRITEVEPDEQKFQMTASTALSSTKDMPTSLRDSFDSQTSDVGSESIDSRYTADWSVEQSSESVHVGLTKMGLASEVQDADVAEEDEEVSSIPSIEESGAYADSFAGESYANSKEDGEILSEIAPVQGSSGTGNDGDVKNSVHDVKSGIKVDPQQDIGISAEYEPDEFVQIPIDDSDKVPHSERVADAIFSNVFDVIITSELKFWSPAQATVSSLTIAKLNVAPGVTTPFAVKTPRESTKRVSRQDATERDRALTQRLVEQLEIVDGEIRLPALDSFDVVNNSTAHVLYDTVENLARACFSEIRQSASGEHILDSSSMLAVIHRHVQSEIDELLSIRAESEHELERQLQLISDESGAETGFSGDVLLSQNCIASNVSSIVSKVQFDFSKTTEELSTAVQSTRPTLLPRTPTSRAKSKSILSSLQTQQDQELQQRITGMIFSDLLRDAGLP